MDFQKQKETDITRDKRINGKTNEHEIHMISAVLDFLQDAKSVDKAHVC